MLKTFQNQLQFGARQQGGFAVKIMSFHVIATLTIVTQVLALWVSTKGGLFPGAETLMSIIGTCAEIIAGLYGITMAGYTFFLSRMDALTASDATLDYVVASVKRRFKYLIWFLTFHFLMNMFISIILMYCPAPTDEDQVFFYRLFCNEFVLSLGSSILLILYYSVLVVDPNCLEKEAQKLKNKLSRPIGPDGSVPEFISMYDRIETLCNGLLPRNVLGQIHENKGRHFGYTIALLPQCHPGLAPLMGDLRRVHRYYECMINCTSLSVTGEMCALARHVLGYLEQVTGKLPQKQ